MKKLLTLFAALMIAGTIMGQAVSTAEPGRTILLQNFALTSIAGADTLVKFIMPVGCTAYSIQCILVDTVETASAGLRLYWTNDGASLTQIGTDSLNIAHSSYPQVDSFTGTTIPGYMVIVQITPWTASDGDLNLILNYYK